MINFYLKINDLNSFDTFNVIKDENFSSGKELNNITLFLSDKTKYIHLRTNHHQWFIIGDIVPPLEFKNNVKEFLQTFLSDFTSEKFRQLNGFFYLIKFSLKDNKIEVYNSFFSILPLFYYQNKNTLAISSHIRYLKELSNQEFTINKKYIAEKLLFNYGFFNRTIFQEINLAPVNHYFQIMSGTFHLLEHTDIRSFFVEKPVKTRKTLNYLADLFIESSRKYFPDDPFHIAFTGGFDGRTLVAIAKNQNKTFQTFSFGSHENDDVIIPSANAKELNIDYTPFYLDDATYTEKNFMPDGLELIELSSGQSNFLYTHFLYSSKLLAGKSKILITGYFGSEMNRSLHIAGAVASSKLIDLYKYNDTEWADRIKQTPRLNFINKDIFKTEIKEIINEVLDYKSNFDLQLTTNQQFCEFLFGESFRKLFGAIITAQMNYQVVRTPFLDFEFFMELMKTKLAGANNSFYTHNPLKRFIGQRLYAEIIKRTSPEMLKMITGKGYTPGDLITPAGNIKILIPFVKKRILRQIKKSNLNNLGLLSGIFNNRNQLINNLKNTELFNDDLIKYKLSEFNNLHNETERDLIIIALSINEYLSKQ
jgi:hypothetical protein